MPSQLRSRRTDATRHQENDRDAHGLAEQSGSEGTQRRSKSASTSASDDDDGDDDDDDEEEDDDEDDEEEESDDNDDDDDAAEAEEDEDDSPFKILERLDPKLLGPGFDPAWLTRKPHQTASHPPVSTEHRSDDRDRSSAAGTDDAEFYGAMIQMLTHVLGSSDSVAWPNQPTPGSQLAPSPFGHLYSSPAPISNQPATSLSVSKRSAAHNRKSELSALQPLIQALISRLGKDQQLPHRPVGEQDLTALLQTLMEQQQKQQQDQQASVGRSATTYAFPQQNQPAQTVSSSNIHRAAQQLDGGEYNKSAHSAYQTFHFADLDFEDEDEDDPDFNPDLNPDLPLPSAWSMAVRDVVASEESRAAAAAAAAASHSGTPSGVQTPANAIRADAIRVGNVSSSARSPPRTAPRTSELGRTSFVEQDVHTRRRSSGHTHVAHTDDERSFSRDNSTSDIEGLTASAPPQLHQVEAESMPPRKRGRKPVLDPAEAKRRRAQRNIEYQRMRRQVKKAEESEQSETVLELRAEVKILRAEMERLRDENATLRAQRELDRLQRTSGHR